MSLFKKIVSCFLAFSLTVTMFSEPLTVGAFAADTGEAVQETDKNEQIQGEAVPANAEIVWASESEADGADGTDETGETSGEPDANGFIIDENGKITGYTGSGGDIVIPDNAASIGDNVFENNMSITSVAMPGNVYFIGEQAFKGCTNLVSVKFSESLNMFTYECFMGCTSLKSVDLPASMEFIGASIFKDCTSLEKVTMREGVKKICVWAFTNCTSLTEITLPSTIEEMEVNTFDHSGLKKVVVSEGITELPQCTFWGCDELESVTLPSTLKTIGKAVFQECSSLKKIDLPSGLETIGEFSFFETGLESIVIPGSVKSIGDGAFHMCRSLKSAELPGGVTNIGKEVFAGCASLSDVSLGIGLTSVPDRCFRDCGKLTSITLPDSIIAIDEAAFEECAALTNVNIPGSVTSIGGWAFSNCSALAELDLPSGLTTIGESAFHACDSLKSVIIPDSVTSLGTAPFDYCDSLESVVVGAGITELSEGAFCTCRSLKSIVLPDGLKTIGVNALANCSTIRNFTLPASVTELGDRALLSWGLRYINFRGTEEQWNSIKMGEEPYPENVMIRCNFTKEEDYIWDPNFRYDESTGILTWDQRPGIPIDTSVDGYEDYACYGIEIVGTGDPEMEWVFSWYDVDWSTPEQKRTGTVSQPDLNLPLAFAAQTVEKDKKLQGEYKLYISGGPGHNIYGMDGSEPFVYNFAGGKTSGTLGVPGSLRFHQNGIIVEWDEVSGAVGYIVRYTCTNGDVYYEQQRECRGFYLDSNDVPRYVLLNCKISVCSVDKNGNMSAWSDPILNSQDELIDKEMSHYSLNGSVNVSGNIPATVSWTIKNLDGVTDAAIFVEIPENAAIAGNVIYMDGETYPITPNNSGEFMVPVTSLTGKFTLYFKRSGATELHTYALLQYIKGGMTHREYIGQIDEEIKDISIELPTKTSQDKVTVSGSAAAEASVQIYAEDTLLATLKANKSGDYFGKITLPNVEDGKEYSVKAVSDGHEATGEVTYESDTPEVTSFVMKYNGKEYDLLKDESYIAVMPVRPIPMRYEIKMTHHEKITKIFVVSTKYGTEKYLKARWNEETQAFVAEGFFDPDDHVYAPGKLSLLYNGTVSGSQDHVNKVYKAYEDMLAQDTNPLRGCKLTYMTNVDGSVDYTLDYAGVEEFEDAEQTEFSFKVSPMSAEDFSNFSGNVFSDTYTMPDGTEVTVKINTDTYKVAVCTSDTVKADHVLKRDALPIADSDSINGQDIAEYITFDITPSAIESFGELMKDMFTKGLGKAAGGLGMFYSLGKNLGELKGVDKSISCKIDNGNMTPEQQELARKKLEALELELFMLAGIEMMVSGLLLMANFATPVGMILSIVGSVALSVLLDCYREYLIDKTKKEIFGDAPESGGDGCTPAKMTIPDPVTKPSNGNVDMPRDPSGTVYEAVTTNPLPGVKATAYWIPADTEDPDFFKKAPDESKKEFWKAEEWGYENPTYTDNTGYYAWDVPEGWWQVKYELDGYETAYSEWLPVPPPQLDVNIGLVSKAAPKADVTFGDKTVTVTFDKYIDPSTITNVVLTAQNGSTLTYTVDYSKDETAADGTVYAKVFTFTADKAIRSIEIPATVLSYSGAAAEAVTKDDPDVPAEEQFDGKVILRRKGADDQEYESAAKALAYIKSLKNEKHACELIINDSITEKSLSIPKNVTSLTIRTTSKGKLTYSGTSISLPCTTVLDCDITQSGKKAISLKLSKECTLTIDRFTAGIGTISGAKGSKLVINSDITAETVKTFDSLDSGTNTLTVTKAMSAANIGTAVLAYSPDIAKNIAVPAISGKLTIAASSAIKSGTAIFQYTGKTPFDTSLVTIGDGALEAFAYKKEVRAMENGLLTVDGTDYPDFEQAFAAMKTDNEYTVLLNDNVPAVKLVLPKTVKKLTIDGGGYTLNIDGALSIAPKYAFVLKNITVKASKNNTAQAVTINAQGGLSLNAVTFDAKSVTLKGKGVLELGSCSTVDTISGFASAKITGAVTVTKAFTVPTIELTKTCDLTLKGNKATLTAKTKLTGADGSKITLNSGFKALTFETADGAIALDTSELSGTVQVFATKMALDDIKNVFTATRGSFSSAKKGKIDLVIG